jgi:hypothetical protein
MISVFSETIKLFVCKNRTHIKTNKRNVAWPTIVDFSDSEIEVTVTKF